MVDSAAGRDRERVLETHRVRVPEIEPLEALGDDDRGAAVRCEIEVVGVLDRYPPAWNSRTRVDRREAVAGVVVDVERLQVVGRGHVLGKPAGGEVLDDLERLLADHVDRVADAVRDVHERQVPANDRAQHVRSVGGVDVDLALGAPRGRAGRRGRERTAVGRSPTRLRGPPAAADGEERCEEAGTGADADQAGWAPPRRVGPWRPGQHGADCSGRRVNGAKHRVRIRSSPPASPPAASRAHGHRCRPPGGSVTFSAGRPPSSPRPAT